MEKHPLYRGIGKHANGSVVRMPSGNLYTVNENPGSEGRGLNAFGGVASEESNFLPVSFDVIDPETPAVKS